MTVTAWGWCGGSEVSFGSAETETRRAALKRSAISRKAALMLSSGRDGKVRWQWGQEQELEEEEEESQRPKRQERQKLWPQGSVTGSVKMAAHTEHRSCSSGRSGPDEAMTKGKESEGERERWRERGKGEREREGER